MRSRSCSHNRDTSSESLAASGPYSAVDQAWDYSVEHEPSEGDLVIDDGPARVFVDPDTAKNLEHAELDAHVDENTLETRFIVRIRDAG